MARVLSLIFAACALSLAAQAQLVSTESITGSRIDCTNGKAAVYSCQGVDLMSLLSRGDYGHAARLNDVWGWTDPKTYREYVLAGRSNAVSFIDISDPLIPVYVGFLPNIYGESSTWRDMKVYRDHMYVVVDGRKYVWMQVFDLTELRSFGGTPIHFRPTTHYKGIKSAHNVVINEETGFAYLVGSRSSEDINCGPGLHMVDIRNPANPTYAGCFTDLATGRRGTGYTHDAQCVLYRGPDSEFYGREICFASNETALSIVDVTKKSSPRKLSSAEYPNAAYAHQGWLTEDHQYFIMNDEFDERNHINEFGGTRMLIWDVKELDDPLLHKEYFGPTHSVDHNLYVRNGYVFAANYTSGLRIIDVQDPGRPFEVAHFDTYPENDALTSHGAWSVYPFFKSGNIVVSSHPHGIFVLKATGLDLTLTPDSDLALPERFALSAAYPNPFNSMTNLSLSVPEAATVSVRAYDLMGRPVASVRSGYLVAGLHQLAFDATRLPSGTYIIRALGEGYISTQRVTLVK